MTAAVHDVAASDVVVKHHNGRVWFDLAAMSIWTPSDTDPAAACDEIAAIGRALIDQAERLADDLDPLEALCPGSDMPEHR